MSQLNGRDLRDNQPYLPAPWFPWKRNLDTHPRQKLQCGATVPAIPPDSISRWLDASQVALVWYFQICMPDAGKAILKHISCWQMALQDMGQGTLEHTAWDDPAPLLCPYFQRECLIMSKYKKYLFLYQRGQITVSSTSSFHVKVRCLIKHYS